METFRRARVRWIALLVLLAGMTAAISLPTLAAPSNPGSGMQESSQLGDLLDLDDDDGTVLDDLVDDNIDLIDDVVDDSVDDNLDVFDDTADDAVDDNLDLLDDGDDGDDDGSDDTVLDDVVDDGLDVFDDVVDDSVDDNLDLLDDTVDDAVDDSTDLIDDNGDDSDDDGVDDGLLDDAVDDGLDLLDDDGLDLVDGTDTGDGLDILGGDDLLDGIGDGEDGGGGDVDGINSLLLPTLLPGLTVDACAALDTNGDGLIVDAEAVASLDLNGNSIPGDADDLLLAQLAVGGGCDPLISPTLGVDVCLDLDLDGDGILSGIELEAALTIDLDADGTAGDLDDLLLVNLAVNGGCADPGAPLPPDPPVLTVDLCVILDADGDGTVLDTDIAALLLVDVNTDGTVGDTGDLALIQAAINGGCADPGTPPDTDPPVITVDICVDIDITGDGILSGLEIAALASVDIDGDGTVGNLDDLLLAQLAINGGCADPGGPGPDGPPILTVDVCVLLDADGDGIVLDADIAAALNTDLDGDGTAGDLNDILLLQAAINGGCGGNGPIDPPVLEVDVCLLLDTNLDGVVATADASAALLLDLDGDGAIADLDDLLLINIAVNGGCGAGTTDLADDGDGQDVDPDGTDADADGTDVDADGTDVDADGTDADDADADTQDDADADTDGTDADGQDDADADADGQDDADTDNADTDGTDADGSDADGNDSEDSNKTVISLPSTGQGGPDDGSAMMKVMLGASGLLALIVTLGFTRKRIRT